MLTGSQPFFFDTRLLQLMDDHQAMTGLPEHWYTLEIRHGVDCALPGLHMWRIEGVGSYIGQYTSISRPTRHYARNLRNLLNGRPYRKHNPDGFRRIHRELANAITSGKRIELIILENATSEAINARERARIAEFGTLNG